MSTEKAENDANAGDTQQDTDAHTMPLATHVKAMLEDLRDVKTVVQAVNCMKILEKFIDVLDSDKEREKARTILDLNGISTIVVALWKWAASQEFSMYALATLCDLVYLEEDSKKVIVDIGGVDTILMAAKKHSLTDAAFGLDQYGTPVVANKETSSTVGSLKKGITGKRSKTKLPTKAQQSKDLPLKSNVVGLLGSLSFSDVSRVVVANEECIDFVMSTMRQYPHHSHMQKWGCIYFFQIAKDLEVKKMLEDKNIITHLAKVVDNFRRSDPLVLEKAKPALKLFL